MPKLDHATFLARLKGRSISIAGLQGAHPELDVGNIAGDGIIAGTSQNLEKLWEIIDSFDRDGNVNTVSDDAALSIADWLFTHADNGEVAVSDAQDWQKIAEEGDRSITEKTQAHKTAIDRIGIGLYYGDHSRFHEDILRGNQSGLQTEIDAMSAGNWRLGSLEPGAVEIESSSGQSARLQESSCIGWVMQNVKAAYEGAGHGERFDEINQKVREADLRGTVLCEELQNDGWTAVFYSPRTAADLSEAGEREKLGALNMAKAGSRVWKSPVSGSNGVRCDAVITGYRGMAPDSETEAQLRKLENVPFFVGVANGGIHTFVGHNGNVCDFHWKAQPDDRNAMTENPVREWEWDTGLYMVPPGYW